MSGDDGEAAPRPRSWPRAGEARPTVVVRRAGPATGGRPLVAHDDGARPPKGWPEGLEPDADDGERDQGAGDDGEADDGEADADDGERDQGAGDDGEADDGDEAPTATYVLWVDDGGAVQTGVLRSPAATPGPGRLGRWVDRGVVGSRSVRPTPASTRAAVARRVDRALAGGRRREPAESSEPAERAEPAEPAEQLRQLAVEVDGRGRATRLRLWRAAGEPALPERAALEAAREDVQVRTRLARSDRGVWSFVPAAILVAPGLIANALAPAYVVPVVVAALAVGVVLAVVVGDRLARWRTERLLDPLGAQRITLPDPPERRDPD